MNPGFTQPIFAAEFLTQSWTADSRWGTSLYYQVCKLSWHCIVSCTTNRYFLPCILSMRTCWTYQMFSKNDSRLFVIKYIHVHPKFVLVFFSQKMTWIARQSCKIYQCSEQMPAKGLRLHMAALGQQRYFNFWAPFFFVGNSMIITQQSVEIRLVVQHSVKRSASWLVEIGKQSKGNFKH